MKKETIWKAPDEVVLPDFIISGAMKSATSSIHNILNQFSEIFMPEGEIGFFDLDDIMIHPDFTRFIKGEWQSQDFYRYTSKCWSWYSSKFSMAGVNQIIGEDSTSYIESKLAFHRISIQEKPIKIIVILRQPSERAYSQYWHMLRNGRITNSFEKTIQYNPNLVLNRSLYLDQLRNLYETIDNNLIYITTFEQFIDSKRTVINEILEFLGLKNLSYSEEILEEKINESQISLFPNLDYIFNAIFRKIGNQRYSKRLPIDFKNEELVNGLLKLLKGSYRIVNPLKRKKKPPINHNTKKFLDNYFKKRLLGIDELTGKNIIKYWF